MDSSPITYSQHSVVHMDGMFVAGDGDDSGINDDNDDEEEDGVARRSVHISAAAVAEDGHDDDDDSVHDIPDWYVLGIYVVCFSWLNKSTLCHREGVI